jgi:sugar lactone lactonase YvrE
MQTSKTTLSIALAGLVLATSVSVAAVTTKSFVLDSADSFFEGELEGTSVRSDGAVRPGAATERIALENVALAYSIARRGDNIFIGTGTSGAVYRVNGKKVEEIANTGELLVSSLAFGRDGALYAGTLPNGRIYRIEPKSGAMKRFSIPDGAKHIWALRYDDKRGQLIAATGPEGKLFAIDSIGRAKELYKAEAPHIMALALDDEGNLFAGTSDSALLIRIAQNGDARVVHDFPGNEVTAIDVREGRIAVAANQFKTAPGANFKAGAPQKAGAPPSTRPRPGSGQLWRIEADGRAEMLVARQDTHFTAVQWGADGAIFAGGGHEGRVFKVDPDATYAIWADVDERQVLALDLRSNDPSFVTGDGAALYRVRSGTPKDAVWTSKALDAAFPSTWGRLTWRGSGRFVFQTRSGNTQAPGDTWSEWSRGAKQAGPVTSPPGRFIQIRAQFPRDETAELRAVELFYLPQNQRARVSNVQGARPAPKRGETTQPPLPPTTLVNLSWKADNPDRDPLRYRVAYQKEGQGLWRDMFSDDVVLKDASYTWDTNNLPDGYYLVRVEASDEEANPDELTLRSSAKSEPIRVDNHPPTIDELSLRKGRIKGRVVDALGPIARIQLAIDAGPWRDVFPADSLLDSGDERFEAPLDAVGPGAHIVAVRAFDAAGNQANREITVKTK